MRKTILLMLIFLTYAVSAQDTIIYPKAFPSNQVDTIWHTPVKDPYRWMEDIRSPQVADWLQAQKKIAKKYSGQTADLNGYLAYYSSLHFKPLVREGKYYFSRAYIWSDNISELYFQKNIDDERVQLFDPNTLDSKNNISIDDYEISSDSKTLALILSKNGSDWRTIRFLDMKKEKLLNDTIDFVKYSNVGWFKNGIFYYRYDVKSTEESFKGVIKNPLLYYHKIGTRQSEDKLILTDTSKDGVRFQFFVQSKLVFRYQNTYENSRKYHVVSVSNLDTTLNLKFRDILFTNIDSIYFNVIGKLNNKWVVESNLDAPHGTLYLFDLNSANKMERFIPECAEQLDYCKIMRNKVVCKYSNDSISYLIIWDSSGKITGHSRIAPGWTFGLFTGNSTDSILIFSIHSFFTPDAMYTLNVNTGETKIMGKTLVNFNWHDIITKKVYYKSKDGITIPMYLTYKEGVKLNGKNPLILYGYGGFGIKTEPFFNAGNIILFRNGGILAAPCLRGGGDYPGWHEQGMRLKKQNTFDDFISAAEYLIANKYTSSEKMVAMGGSNGGLLVAAVMLQRPDLFRVVIDISGVHDMLRYNLYNVGDNESFKEEYGNITDSVDFKNLLKYSPVQNVKKGITYPATLFIAGDNDDRVNPFNSFKFLAALQANGVSTKRNPYVLSYEKKAGHNGENGAGDDVYIYAFIYKYLGLEGKIILPEN